MSDESEPSLKKCVRCYSDIPSKSTFCKECKGYQNWRRHVNFSTTILALMIALVSVTASFFSLISEKIWPPESEIVLEYASYDDGILRVAAINSGEAKGYITGVTLGVNNKQQVKGLPGSIGFHLLENIVEVPPNETTPINVVMHFKGSTIGNISQFQRMFGLSNETVENTFRSGSPAGLYANLGDDGSMITNSLDYKMVLKVLNSDGESTHQGVPFGNNLFIESFIDAVRRCQNDDVEIDLKFVVTKCDLKKLYETEEYLAVFN